MTQIHNQEWKWRERWFETGGSSRHLPPAIIVKNYNGNLSQATTRFRNDANTMAEKGYYPTTQVWIPGSYSGGDFLAALIFCFLLIGIIIFIYMLLVTPPGTLSVTYEKRSISPQATNVTKTAPGIEESYFNPSQLEASAP